MWLHRSRDIDDFASDVVILPATRVLEAFLVKAMLHPESLGQMAASGIVV